MDRMKDRLDALWVEYREATPDPEAGPNFMPQLWQKIEARRIETTSVFRRLAQICVMATIALALVIGAVLDSIAAPTKKYSIAELTSIFSRRNTPMIMWRPSPRETSDELLSQEHRPQRGACLRVRSRARCFRRSPVHRDDGCEQRQERPQVHSRGVPARVHGIHAEAS